LQITLFTFKGHNLLNFSLISTIFFIPLDVPRKEPQSLLECEMKWSNIQKKLTQKHKLNYYVQFLQISLFIFKRHDLLVSSLISTCFVPLDAPNGELQFFFEV
jgi:hypothetical protein